MVPDVSIIIPVFNDPGYLAEALASVLAQTLGSWEAVVVDDGSTTGGAAAVVASVGDARLRLLRHDENRGLAAARNTGIRAASSDLLVTLDADDQLEPGYLAAVVEALGPGSPYNCAFTDFVVFGAREDRIPNRVRSDLSTLLRHQWIPGPGSAFRRSLWELAGGYCEAPELRAGNEDRDFWVAALGVGLRPVHIPEPLYRYRVGHASMMTRLAPVVWKTHVAIHARHRDLYERHGAGPAFLADGYLTSAEAVRTAGRRREAMALALRGIRHQPLRFEGFGIIGRALLPGPLHTSLRFLRRRLARGKAT